MTHRFSPAECPRTTAALIEGELIELTRPRFSPAERPMPADGELANPALRFELEKGVAESLIRDARAESMARA